MYECADLCLCGMSCCEEQFQLASPMEINRQDKVIHYFLTRISQTVVHVARMCQMPTFITEKKMKNRILLIIWNSLYVNQLKEIDLM